MRYWSVSVITVAFLTALADPIRCQAPPQGNASSQIRKEWALGQHLAQDLERRDGGNNDPAIVGYLQRIENQITLAMGANPLEIRLTRSSDRYASLLPHGVLYISGGLLERVESEAELAGLLAHQLEHAQQNRAATARSEGIRVYSPACVLASQFAPIGWGEEAHERELQATTASVKGLKAAGYEPSAILDLLSKLAYEHPGWAKAILSEDLLNLRAALEGDIPPSEGYLIDSSEFIQQRAKRWVFSHHR